MEQFVILTRERATENQKWTDFFTITDSTNPEQTLRDAIRAYLLTEEGKASIKESSEDFNWGDAVLYVPDEFWNKHGIKEISEGESVILSHPIIINVDQDEILIPAEYYEKEEV